MSLFYLIIFCQTQGIISGYLDASNYRSPKIERNNIVNKGVWVRSFKDSDKTGNFLFRGNAIDVDNIVQGDFNAFGDGAVPNSPFISSYVDRSKRSLDELSLKRYRKSLNNENVLEENDSLIKSKLVTKIKPASVFNDYPYEIAILLGNYKQALDEAKNYSAYVINEMIKNDNQSVIPLTKNNVTKFDKIVREIFNKTNSTVVPKRSMKSYESEVVTKLELLEELNSNQNNNKTTDSPRNFVRDVFAKEDRAWQQSAPLSESHKYKVIGKNDDLGTPKSVRPVTERGLIKVLSMLTNTFKKIMKQHSDIKEIHKKLNAMNDDFLKNIEIISDKFQDFDSKYANLVTFEQKFNELELKHSAREQHFRNKEKELAKNLIEFEVQQKKFLTQQKQFYNIQKLMLAQNERINAKQNAIAKTQSEISHRQNNFARILKKAKQVYIDSQNRHNPPKASTAYVRIDKTDTSNETKTEDTETNSQIVASKSQPTESIKINLFSIPVPAKLKNQDHLLLNEKDEQPVDDLVYKYYFNNTFIDSLMKNFLSGYISTSENNDNNKNFKAKRDEIGEEKTILLPVSNPSNNIEENAGKSVNRNRRWISHHSRGKYHRKNRGKVESDKSEIDDERPVRNPPANIFDNEPEEKDKIPMPSREKKMDIENSDPFIAMATNFCNGIGQNTNAQVLGWCIEKALRRLKNIDIKVPPPPAPVPEVTEKEKEKPKERKDKLLKRLRGRQRKERLRATEKELYTTGASTSFSEYTTSPLPTARPETAITVPVPLSPASTAAPRPVEDNFFPDNDKLEKNLKEFELNPDTEGNVYYDGSLHASDLVKDDKDEDQSLLPGLDSNSRIDNLDPDMIDNRALRREFLQRSLLSRLRYESMLKKVKKL